MALSLLSAVVRSLDSTEKTKRMCAVLRLVTDSTCLAAFRVYWKYLKLKFMCVCQRKANVIVQEQFLINDHIFVVSQGPPDHCELKSTRIAVSVSQCLFPSHILPLTPPSVFSLTHNLPALVCPVCGEAFGGRRHTSKPAFASTLIYGSPSLTCLKSMYLHGFEGYKQSRGESQCFVWL